MITEITPIQSEKNNNVMDFQKQFPASEKYGKSKKYGVY
jgi:hypothetical protein